MIAEIFLDVNVLLYASSSAAEDKTKREQGQALMIAEDQRNKHPRHAGTRSDGDGLSHLARSDPRLDSNPSQVSSFALGRHNHCSRRGKGLHHTLFPRSQPRPELRWSPGGESIFEPQPSHRGTTAMPKE